MYDALKLCKGPTEWAKVAKVLDAGAIPVLDAENYYKKDMQYSRELGKNFKAMGFVGLLPENLGGKKYAGYDEFVLGLRPEFVCMEGTYNIWQPNRMWELQAQQRGLEDKGIKVYTGIWPNCQYEEHKLNAFQKAVQRWSAYWSSNIFNYSERKELP